MSVRYDSDLSVVVDDSSAPGGRHPRLLVTNDDGIESPGIRMLARRLAVDFDLVVVAPQEDMSGTGTALGRFDPASGVGMVKHDLEGVDEALARKAFPNAHHKLPLNTQVISRESAL